MKPRALIGAGLRRLLAVWGAIGLVWLAVLPAIAERPRVKARLETLKSQGIDPSAMYYSELDAMDDVLARLDRFHRRHPQALWQFERK